ncbi:toxic anion resistance protein [Candidatus Protofrankia californiensis]|uniref:toxic anion resistance protein n=1 Tax=Candidatus Protofrankia californiensis TaxID=1839754 RepID=UPI001F493F25|nr:toxic anion resistance protein [Candidatus Protofrankia californiensis]
MSLPPTTPTPAPSPGAGDPGAQLVLVPPAPVAPVTPDQAGPAVPISAEAASRLADQAVAFADALVGVDPTSPAFTSKVAAVHRMGEKEIRASASVSNRLLDKPTRAMNSGAFDATSSVSTSLVELRRVVSDLDPSKANLLGPKKLLGVIPFGNRLRDYFASYRSSQAHLDAILHSLQNGQEELRRDNAAIEQEKHNLWTTMGKLREYTQLASNLDAELVTRIDRIEAGDPDRARALREDVLFYVRQKHQDLLTQLAVSAQGYLALEMIRRNNLELIKGVDRASTTTVAALRTAVLVAQALANQKLVLDQIAALNETTERIIIGTSELLRQQTVEIHGQAASSTVSVQALQQAFANIYATIDTIDGYKTAALATMRTTVEALSDEVGKAAAYLDRAAATAPAEIAQATAGELEISGGGQ